MSNKILVIGVGSSGVRVADKIDIPNCKKLFIDSNPMILREVRSDGEKLEMECKEREQCSSLYCHCLNDPNFCRAVAENNEDEIRTAIIRALE